MTPDLGPVFQNILTPAPDPGPKKCRILLELIPALRIRGNLCHVAHNTQLLKAFYGKPAAFAVMKTKSRSRLKCGR